MPLREEEDLGSRRRVHQKDDWLLLISGGEDLELNVSGRILSINEDIHSVVGIHSVNTLTPTSSPSTLQGGTLEFAFTNKEIPGSLTRTGILI